MKFLGILLIIIGISAIFSGSVMIFLLFVTLGAICISSSCKSKRREATESEDRQKDFQQETKQNYKEDWILTRTKKYMDEGLLPSDAKVKAEVDFLQEHKKDPEENSQKNKERPSNCFYL